MGDYLIPYVEFLGLPGSGKSYYSHKVADALRSDAYQVVEPSWKLDHTEGKYMRAIKKTVMSSLFCIGHHHQTKRGEDWRVCAGSADGGSRLDAELRRREIPGSGDVCQRDGGTAEGAEEV